MHVSVWTVKLLQTGQLSNSYNSVFDSGSSNSGSSNSGSSNSGSIHQIYDSTLPRLRTRPCNIRLNDES